MNIVSLKKRCEIPPNPCNSQPCQNGGLCSKVTDTTYTCSCVNGYTGSLKFLILIRPQIFIYKLRKCLPNSS